MSHAVDLAARAITMASVHAKQPLTSIEAFALALVEASSRLDGTDGASTGDAPPLAAPPDDEAVAAVE